jgi:hypothetical protein
MEGSLASTPVVRALGLRLRIRVVAWNIAPRLGEPQGLLQELLSDAAAPGEGLTAPEEAC